jgi:dihydroorotate dehydrogenase
MNPSINKNTLFISPPFGNYISILPNTINIRGSFTYEPRNGLFGQIFKTLRYNSEYGGWTNQIGLRNKGIHFAIGNYYAANGYKNRKNEIISLAIRNNKDVKNMVSVVPKDMNIEINVSCPNVKKSKLHDIHGLGQFLNNERKWCIMKLPPTISKTQIDEYYTIGFRQFHCSNTLPNSKKYLGGLSGPVLVPYTLKNTEYIKSKYKDTIVICGGGIRTMEDIDRYKKAGGDYFSVSTVAFNPYQLLKLYTNYCIMDYIKNLF